ncbi:hypothetical protein A4A49_60540, partial [Nicotiana attenuata]
MMIKTLIWNIWSVNTQQAFRRVINMKKGHNFFVIALMEHFQKARHIQRYRRRLNMESAFTNLNRKIWLFFDVVVEWELIVETNQ